MNGRNQMVTSTLERNTCAGLALGVLALAWLAGCQSEGQIEVAPVNGVVTLDGEPLTQGTVIFTAEKGRGARGEIGSDGSFTLGTYGEDDGATIGKHLVSIIALEGEVAFEGEVEQKSLIPSRYAAPATSGLEFEVKAGVHNSPKFSLLRE